MYAYINFRYSNFSDVNLKPGSQYDAGASVVSPTSRALSAKTGVPVHNLAFASIGGVVEVCLRVGLYMNPAPGEVRSARAQRVMPRGSGRWRSKRAKRRLLVIWLAYWRLKQRRTWRSVWIRPIFARRRSQDEYHDMLQELRMLIFVRL